MRREAIKVSHKTLVQEFFGRSYVTLSLRSKGETQNFSPGQLFSAEVPSEANAGGRIHRNAFCPRIRLRGHVVKFNSTSISCFALIVDGISVRSFLTAYRGERQPIQAKLCYDRLMYLWLKKHIRTVLLVGFLLAILPSYLRLYSLTGASAAPTILLGDKFIVNRAAYDFRVPYSRITLFHTGSLRRGDIVQAQLPAHIGPGIKRVLGLPGEMIEVHENLVIVNGKPLPVQPFDNSSFGWVPAVHHMGSTVVMEDGHWAAYTPEKSQY